MNNSLAWKKEIFPFLNDEIISSINKLPTSLLQNISEIRLRCCGSVSVSILDENKILYYNGKPISLAQHDIENIFNLLCNNTVFKFENQIKNGYITIEGGHRVGFCGSAIYENDKILTLNNITSIVFRISRQIKNAAREIIGNIYEQGKVSSTLIVSEPCGGKTTILTDLARIFSGLGIRSAVIDERGEICSMFNGHAQKDIGSLTDVLNEYKKQDGLSLALRCLSPQVIICDEIGASDDIDMIIETMNAGVPVIATAHASNEDEILDRPQIERLVDSGAIDKIIVLKGNKSPGVIKKVITINQYDETSWNSNVDD